eukprot:1137677-Pelagomonas_calceolata.AAC.3
MEETLQNYEALENLKQSPLHSPIRPGRLGAIAFSMVWLCCRVARPLSLGQRKGNCPKCLDACNVLGRSQGGYAHFTYACSPGQYMPPENKKVAQIGIYSELGMN